MCTDEEIDGNSSSLLSSYLKSSSCNSESKVIFLEEFFKYIEKDIEALEVKIQSLSFQNPFQLYFDIKIEKCYENKDKFDDSKLKQWNGKNCTHGLFNHNNQILEYIEGYYDPISNYMEEFIDSRFHYILLWKI